MLWQKAITKRIVEHALEGSWGQGVLGCAIFAGPYNLQYDKHYWVLQYSRNPRSYFMALGTSEVLEDCSKVLREAGEDRPNNNGTRIFLEPQVSLAVCTHLTEHGRKCSGATSLQATTSCRMSSVSLIRSAKRTRSSQRSWCMRGTTCYFHSIFQLRRHRGPLVSRCQGVSDPPLHM